jgi:hypothetical protein
MPNQPLICGRIYMAPTGGFILRGKNPLGLKLVGQMALALKIPWLFVYPYRLWV